MTLPTPPTLSIKEIGIISFFSLLFSLLWFLPVFNQLGTSQTGFSFSEVFFQSSNPEHTLGADVDLEGTIWIVGKMDEFLKGESSSFLTDIFAPVGYDFGMATGFAWLDAILAVPLLRWIGNPGFYNLYLLLVLICSVFSIIFLLRKLNTSLFFAITLSHLLLFSPFVLQEVNAGRPTQINWFFPCFYLFGVLQMIRGDKLYQWSIFTAFSLVGGCFVYWFSAIAVGFCGGLLFLFHSLQEQKRCNWLAGALTTSLSLGLTIAITHRVSVPLLRGSGHNAYMKMDKPPVDEWLGLPIQKFIAVDAGNLLTQTAIPLLILLVGLPALIFLGKKHWPLILTTLISLGIPTGAALGSSDFFLPTGYNFLHWIFPPLIRCQWPMRMMIAPSLMLLVCFSLALSSFGINRKKLFSIQWILCILLLLGNITKQPTSKELVVGKISTNQDLIAITQEYSGGIIEVPYIASYDTYTQQIHHKQPILGGPGLHSIRPEKHKRYCSQNRLLHGLEEISAGIPISTPYSQKDLLELWRDGFRIIIIYLDKTNASKAPFERFLGVKSHYYPESNLLLFQLPEP